jgi:hypothetical protein
VTKSKLFDWSNDDVSTTLSSQVDHEFDDSTRIKVCGCVESKQKSTTIILVVVPLVFGHRSIAVGEVKWQQMAAHDTSEIQPQKNMH